MPAGLCRTALQAAKKAAIHTLLEQLEQINPQPHPLDHEDMLAGDWRLLYSTITITVCCWGEGGGVWLEGRGGGEGGVCGEGEGVGGEGGMCIGGGR